MMRIKIPKIGLRNIKTAVAVFLSLILSFIFARESSFYSCIGAVMCMQSSYDKTFMTSINRMVGTCLGGVAGYFTLEFLLYYVQYYETLKIILLPIGVSILIYTCLLLKKPGASAICCVVFLNITLNIDRGIANTFWYVADRVVDTLIGIIAAMVVDRWLKVPTKWKKYLARFVSVE